MKTVLACVLVALCVCSIEAKPWGKYINISVNKQYDGPNFADILSSLVRQKMEFKNSLWNSFISAKTQSYNYNYDAKPYFTKTITINKNVAPASSNHSPDCKKDVHVDVEVITQPPIPVKKAPLVQHEKTFEFRGSFSSGSSTHAAASSSSSSSSNDSSSQYLPPKESGRSNSDSDLVSIRELQKDNE